MTCITNQAAPEIHTVSSLGNHLDSSKCSVSNKESSSLDTHGMQLAEKNMQRDTNHSLKPQHLILQLFGSQYECPVEKAAEQFENLCVCDLKTW